MPTPSAPTTPPPSLARVVVAERDQIRVRVELQRNPLPAGELSWVKVTVTNRGTGNVTWFHDGCAQLASVYGASVVAWPMGGLHTGQAAMFKTYALGGHIALAPDAHAAIDFVRKDQLSTGALGCADIGMSDTIGPGKHRQQTMWWSGSTTLTRAVPPSGPVTITAYAGYYWRGSKEPSDIVSRAIDLELDAWIIGDAPAPLSPAQAVDAALADPAFAAYLETQTLANGRAEIAWFDAARKVWEIGVMPWYESDPPRIHGVIVDGVTGRIIGPLDRAWDQDTDPFP
ncbi:MAG: hypothetical protein ABIR11_11970 [Candidatus Limnocylindrales bacterium]